MMKRTENLPPAEITPDHVAVVLKRIFPMAQKIGLEIGGLIAVLSAIERVFNRWTDDERKIWLHTLTDQSSFDDTIVELINDLVQSADQNVAAALSRLSGGRTH